MAVPIPKILSWPLAGLDTNGKLAYASNDDSVREVIRNILLTRPGERLMRPEFGAGLMDFIHQPNNETTRNLMANVIQKSVEQWEPRVVVDAVDVLPDRESLSTVQIIIRYHMRHLNQIRELSFGLDLQL